jgi:hypothetical protein
MSKRRKSAEEEEELEEETGDERSGILRDGQRVRVSLFMRDGSISPDLLPHQRAKALAARQTQTEDALARKFGLSDAMQLHKPGFRRNTDVAALERSRAAYAAADAADAQAYKQTRDYDEHGGDEPRNTGTGAPAKGSGAPAGAYPLSAGEGSECSVDGRSGTLVRQGNWLVCKPRSQDAASFDAKQAAYEAYDREMSVAYLRGK